MLFWVFVLVRGDGVRMWVGFPCPPVRNDIVTPGHLFCEDLLTCLTLYVQSHVYPREKFLLKNHDFQKFSVYPIKSQVS